jgi:endogenous inhibitor of DNA gyrase (YacG/DUF329 family)
MGKTSFRKRHKESTACKNCGKAFVRKTWNQLFCSVQCKNDWFNDRTSKALSEYYAAKEAGKI